MNAKYFLSRGRWLEREITALMQTRDETRSRLTRVTQNYEADGAQSTKDPHKFDALLELEDKLDERIDALCSVKTEILEAIGKLEDGRERLVLQLYYIDMKSWEQVAVDLNYSWRQTMNIRKRAIRNIEAIIA